MSASGLTVVRLADIPWEDRINVDNWPSKGRACRSDEPPRTTMRSFEAGKAPGGLSCLHNSDGAAGFERVGSSRL